MTEAKTSNAMEIPVIRDRFSFSRAAAPLVGIQLCAGAAADGIEHR